MKYYLARRVARRRNQAMRIKARIEKAIGGPLEEILSSGKPNELNEPNEPNNFCEA